jgi:hypothetical protein
VGLWEAKIAVMENWQVKMKRGDSYGSNSD